MDNFKPKLLLVDGDLESMKSLQRTLGSQDYKLEFSNMGMLALEMTKNQEFDMVLLDFRMPDIDGPDICKIIRTNQEYESIPILFLSAVNDKNSIMEGFNAGAQDFIAKPFDPGELLARVKTHLSIRISREQLKETNRALESQVKEKKGQLEKFKDELEELDSNKMNFLRIISHEIRTPLNTLLGPITLIKSSLKGKKYKDLVDMLDASANRLERFTLTALAITELKTVKRQYTMENIDLIPLVKEILVSLTTLSGAKKLGIGLVTDTSELIIYGNRALVKMCFKGIIENAVIFSPDEGSVEIRLEKTAESALCEISDEGPGFSELALKYLFQLFMPGEPHIDQNLGLDLTLARLIMDAHLGTINVGNLPGCGARVSLDFPVCNDELNFWKAGKGEKAE